MSENQTPSVPSEVLPASKSDLASEQSRKEQLLIEQLEQWTGRVEEDISAILKKHGIETAVVSFYHHESGRPLMIARGELLRLCRIATNSTRMLQEQVRNAAGLPPVD
jgi:hypothetical protein